MARSVTWPMFEALQEQWKVIPSLARSACYLAKYAGMKTEKPKKKATKKGFNDMVQFLQKMFPGGTIG